MVDKKFWKKILLFNFDKNYPDNSFEKVDETIGFKNEGRYENNFNQISYLAIREKIVERENLRRTFWRSVF